MTSPFADLDTFEALRSAALEGNEAFQRHRRRESVQQRRNMARVVELQLTARVQRMVEVAVASSRAVLLVGPPGTGKTEILEQIIDQVDRDPKRFGLQGEGVDSTWVTPEEEWTFEKLVLGETIVGGEIQSVEGELLQSLRRRQWLILDETNRADMDRVLGGVLTWLSGKRVRVGLWRDPGSDQPRPVFLEWTDEEGGMREIESPPSRDYVADADWRLLGTYNAVDAQRVFRMGQALSRRFKHVPVPPAGKDDFLKIVASHVTDDVLLPWLSDRVTRLYQAHLEVHEAQLGPGLFVDIPRYVEHGLRMARIEQTESEPDGVSVVEASGAETSPDVTWPSVSVETEGPTDLPASEATLREELLAEAYLISVGPLVAKYEDDLFDELAGRMASLEALTPLNWAWVQESLRSMRA